VSFQKFQEADQGKRPFRFVPVDPGKQGNSQWSIPALRPDEGVLGNLKFLTLKLKPRVMVRHQTGGTRSQGIKGGRHSIGFTKSL